MCKWVSYVTPLCCRINDTNVVALKIPYNLGCEILMIPFRLWASVNLGEYFSVLFHQQILIWLDWCVMSISSAETPSPYYASLVKFHTVSKTYCKYTGTDTKRRIFCRQYFQPLFHVQKILHCDSNFHGVCPKFSNNQHWFRPLLQRWWFRYALPGLGVLHSLELLDGSVTLHL